MVHTIDDDASILKDNIDKLDKTLSCVDENGLFENCTNDNCADIVDAMLDSYRDIESLSAETDKSKKSILLASAWHKYRSAYYQLNMAINSSTPFWRFQYLFGGPFLIYLIALLGVAFSAWFLFTTSFDSAVLWVPAYAYVWGLIGGALQGLWFIWQHASDRKFRKVWVPWYILLPFMGSLFGALTYLVFSAGFFATTGTTKVESGAFIMLLCALAGFSTKWMVETLNKITAMININVGK